MKFKSVVILITTIVIIGAAAVHLRNVNENIPDNSIIESSASNSDESVSYWSEEIKQLGGTEAYQLFKTKQLDQPTEGHQHSMAHNFGEALYKALGVAGVPVCDSDFGFGCYHSFFGFAIMDKGLEVMPELDQACIAAYGNKGLGCQHGIGHGVIVEMGYPKLADALLECSKLDWQGPIGGCSSGVLMEFNHHTMDESGPRMPINNDYHYPCTEVESRFIEACYFEQPAWWNVLEGTSYTFIGEQCELAPNILAKEACYRGVGNMAAGVLSNSIPDVSVACKEMTNPEGEILCIEGAAWIISYQPTHKDTWTELCEPFSGAYYKRCILSHDFI